MGKHARILSLMAAFGAALTGPSAWAGVLVDWPCKGCFTQVPDEPDGGAPAEADPRRSAAPRPLLVALHGDGGGASKLFQSWKTACEAAGVILVAPRCPVDLGCPAGSWWQWYFSGRHDPAWLGAQIDAVTARFPVDAARVYATGYSGGGTYLGDYGPENPRRFAAIAYVAGGMPFHVPCPSCKLPVLFVIGATDPMVVPYTRPLREYYEGCGGHEVVWESLRGVSHEGILDVLRAGKAKEILGWLLARPASCTVSPVVDAGLDASVDAGGQEAGALPVAPAAASSVGGEPPARPERPPPGCGCAVAEGGEGAAAILAGGLLTAVLAGRRRRRVFGRVAR